LNAFRRFKPLQSREHRDCTVLPYRRSDGGFEMGVLDASGACIPETLLSRTYSNGKEGRIGRPGDFGPAAASHAGPAIWLGPLLDGYGHFLLESLARAWLAREHPETPLVWSCRAPGASDEPEEEPSEEPAEADRAGAGPLRSWQRGILDLLGVRNPIVCLDAPARFERLIVPDIGYQVQGYFHPAHAGFLAAVPHRPQPGRKLWLSRGKLRQLQNASMPEVERRLADLGWTIVHPERLPVAEQMAHVASAERIAAEQGSALHSVVLLKDPQELRVDFFLRDPTRARYNRNYDTIAAAKGLRQRAIRIDSEVVVERKGRNVSKYAPDPGDYLEALGEAPATAAAAPPAPAPDLDAIAREFNTDKASVFVNRRGETVDGHDYCRFYEFFLRDFRDRPITLVELGCGPLWNIGASLRMFRKYLPEARIVGVDNKRRAKRLEAEGFEICVGDLGDPDFVRSLRRFRPSIIVDDASHLWAHQILSISELYGSLESGGLFIMEDINTSFGPLRSKYGEEAGFSGHDFVAEVCRTIHSFDLGHLDRTPCRDGVRRVAADTAFVAQHRHTAVFVKRGTPAGA
jgi:hypothetical protein